MFGSIGVPELVVILLIAVVPLALVAWPAGRICQRIGFSPWLGLVAVIPIANLVLLWFVALANWPALPPGQR
jgi:hypothetical protein